MTPRIVLGSVALFAMVRFFITPTWPCALVVLGALAVAVAAMWLESRAQAADAAHLAKLAVALEDVSSRLATLERGRALGGL